METIQSPAKFLISQIPTPLQEELHHFEKWWWQQGAKISQTVDAARTPWLKHYNHKGERIDEIQYPSNYWTMLQKGYQEGIIWRFLEERSLLPSYQLMYVVSFFDPGLSCPYTVSLSTAAPLLKYGTQELQNKYLPLLGKKEELPWQGATWMTEIKGGSDLGTAVETTAQKSGNGVWLLNGQKYFASNAGAELAVVAARPLGAPLGVRGLELFLLPKYNSKGQLNYTIQRMKNKIGTRSVPTAEILLENSEAYLLGEEGKGIYRILDVLNVSRVANCIGSVGLIQRALWEAFRFASQRKAFGKAILEHPLLRKEWEEKLETFQKSFALAWEAVSLLEEVWQEIPPYSERYHYFRLVAHMAKYWTAEQAVQTAKWTMEVWGGLGILEEFFPERLLREAMILPIWEGTPHRQALDAWEVMRRKKSHTLLWERLKPWASEQSLAAIQKEVEEYLQLPETRQESQALDMLEKLAKFSAIAFLRQLSTSKLNRNNLNS
ncbi:MAG: acyl-CoA dehydrogenase [Planctomycetota bacterium]|nr:MAG: acyl-CoA dehydrogenase [Planctomycetota bacterium]